MDLESIKCALTLHSTAGVTFGELPHIFRLLFDLRTGAITGTQQEGSEG